MIEAATTSTSTSTARSYAPQQQQEQHEHLTSLLGFRSEPGHLKCRSSLRGREWHIESASQVPLPSHVARPFPYLHIHTHLHQFAAHMPSNDAHWVRYVWPGQRWPSHPLEPQLSCCPSSLPLYLFSFSRSPPPRLAGSCVECGGDCKNKLTWKLKKEKKIINICIYIA